MSEIQPFKSWIKDQKLDNKPTSTVCSYCNGNGYLYARPRELEYPYSTIFRCFCPIGTNKRVSWPQWGKRYEYKYELEKR